MSPSSLRHQLGRLLIIGFAGEQIPGEVKTLAREFGLGGVILFARNIVEPEQVAELCAEALLLDRDFPLWVSVDQEGGRVARLRAPFTKWPPMATLGRSGDVKLAQRFARALAAELKAVGFNLDYAPVLDIHTNPSNPVIGDRALADRADEVARLGVAIVEALQDSGVAACGKHFPGHGDTSADSHYELPLVDHPPDRIRGVELVPFKAAVDAGIASIMTAHVLLPSFDEERPATLSRRVVSDLLRDELAFGGVVISDDLEMKAIASRYAVPEAAVLAVDAGCDALLVCGTDTDLQAAAIEALIHAVEDERLPFSRVENALARQRTAKEQFLLAPAPSRPLSARALRQMIGTDEHRAIADQMAQFL
jgi:beta-N-acetylhexosaminidase